MIPLKINNKHLCQIFEPGLDISGWSTQQIQDYSISKKMFPTAVGLVSETYSRNAERTADYELENLTIVNRKAKPEFTWTLIEANYVTELFNFLDYTYNFVGNDGDVVPVEAPKIRIEYYDFVGLRIIDAYLGQTIEGTLVEYDGNLYWENLRIAFPER